mmetsp:Transcript_5442/g.12525  ORF Transcript_5442/g.12525 Transcript_5442/m.12525 type:complete len:168 (-) Transcript_5442:659-1162(-)
MPRRFPAQLSMRVSTIQGRRCRGRYLVHLAFRVAPDPATGSRPAHHRVAGFGLASEGSSHHLAAAAVAAAALFVISTISVFRSARLSAGRGQGTRTGSVTDSPPTSATTLTSMPSRSSESMRALVRLEADRSISSLAIAAVASEWSAFIWPHTGPANGFTGSGLAEA